MQKSPQKLEIEYTSQADEDIAWLKKNNLALYKKCQALIEEIQLTPFTGTGKPEPLKHEWSGYWSRRISSEHRLVYLVHDGVVYIAQARFHY